MMLIQVKPIEINVNPYRILQIKYLNYLADLREKYHFYIISLVTVFVWPKGMYLNS